MARTMTQIVLRHQHVNINCATFVAALPGSFLETLQTLYPLELAQQGDAH